MTARDALKAALDRLHAAGVPDAVADARRLLEHAAGLAPGMLTTHADRIDAAALARFATLIERRAARVPVSHLTGHRDFYGRRFCVTPDTLDPRQDTEILIGQALSEPFARVLDLGTGTGCILLTLLAERPGTTGIGADISPAALAVARRNAAALGLEGRAGLILSDWWGSVTGTFDLIVSNPPYIAAGEMDTLSPEVRDHEPHLALTDGADGLGAYRAIATGLHDYLAPGGRLIVEIGFMQARDVSGILAAAGLTQIEVHKDLEARDRVITARRPADCG